MALVKRKSTSPQADTEAFIPNALRMAALASDKKAKNIKIYDVRGLTLVADAFVVITATSEPQLKAVYNAVKDGMDEIKVCVGYEVDGKRIERFPFTMGAQAKLKPIYETFDGWSESTQGARSFAELPATCIKYVRRVEELVGCPVALLSTSPQREDTILMTDPFRD